MSGTREGILGEIRKWIKNPAAHQICWITGKAGSGKSSIAKTVCVETENDSAILLGGSFFCSRSSRLAAQRDVRCVVPTLTQLLAQKSTGFRKALFETIDSGDQYKEVAVQIEKLLYTPLLALKDSSLSILFVIDALDECGGETSDGILNDQTSRDIVTSMLEALTSLTQSDVKIPIKFLVTSRPETHIRDTSVSDSNHSQIFRLYAVNKTDVDADIHRYIEETLDTKLSRKPKIRVKFTERDIADLVLLCDGLFIVAATALKHIFVAGVDAAAAKFDKLLNASRDGFDAGVAAPLDELYAVILADTVGADGHDVELPTLQRVLASILSARVTLSITALGDLLELDVRAFLSHLHAVVHVPEDDDEPGLRTVHASFGDYLFDRASDRIRIYRSFGHEVLAHACFDVMEKRLHFNISQSHSSYESNASKQSDNIPLSLAYACLHWPHHITAPSNPALDLKIGRIFRSKLLFWLELLSIMRRVGLAAGLLRIAASAVSLLPQHSYIYSVFHRSKIPWFRDSSMMRTCSWLRLVRRSNGALRTSISRPSPSQTRTR